MYDTILVATDGSDPAVAASERAVELAAWADATLHALYVIENIDAIVPPMTGEQADVREESEAYAEEVTGDVAGMAAEAGVDYVGAIERGVAQERIVDYADEEGIDLVVLGASGWTNVADALLGSTVERVSRKTDASVLIAR